MSDDPFLMLSRGYFEHSFWVEPRVYSRAEAWLDFVRMAAWRTHRRMIGGSLIEIPRGGIVATERFLSDRWMWSRTKVRAFVDLLSEDKMVRREKNQSIAVLVLCNYERFNTPNGSEKTAKEPRKNQGETKVEEGIEAEVREKRRGSQPNSAEEIKTYASVFPQLPKPDTAFCDWFWDEGEKRGWTDPANGEPWRDWKAAFRASWRGAVHNRQERDDRARRPSPNIPPKPIRTIV